MCLYLFNCESFVRVTLIVWLSYLIRLSKNEFSLCIGWESCNLMCLHTHIHMCLYTHSIKMHESAYGAYGRGCEFVNFVTWWARRVVHLQMQVGGHWKFFLALRIIACDPVLTKKWLKASSSLQAHVSFLKEKSPGRHHFTLDSYAMSENETCHLGALGSSCGWWELLGSGNSLSQ